MSGARHHILHVGGSVTDARMIRDALTASTRDFYDVEWVDTLAKGLERLTASPPNAILLDLRLPRCHDGGELAQLQRIAAVPILVVCADENEEIAQQALLSGAHDYLLAKHLDSYSLPRALSSAIEHQLAAAALVAEMARVEATVNFTGDALLNTDMSGRITYLNRHAEAITGWARGDAVGKPLPEVLHFVDDAMRGVPADPIAHAMREAPAPGLAADCILRRRDGSEAAVKHWSGPIRDRQGRVIGAEIVVRDISAARATALRLAHLASHDPLTDLPNRALLSDRLGRSLALARRYRRHVAVLFLDLDRFKDVNDALGHHVGDELLQAVAQAVTRCVRSSDTVGRQGGDEFVVVLSELTHPADAAKGAQKIITALEGVHRLSGHEVHITASIGISVYPEDGEDAETLLTHADMALYHAKDQGRGCYRFFRQDLQMPAVAPVMGSDVQTDTPSLQQSRSNSMSITARATGVVALFNASDDTVDMVRNLLIQAKDNQQLIGCHFADLKRGVVDFARYVEKHNPEVVIFDLSPPYDENWHFFESLRDAPVMQGRGMVLTTTNKNRLDEVLGSDSHALEVVGRPKDLKETDDAIRSETERSRRAPAA